MWLLIPEGFYSVVRKTGDDRLCVRARVAADLDRLRESYLPSLTATEESAGTDYRYRAWAAREDVAEALASITRNLDYGNFKDAVARRDWKRADVYHDVWETLGRLQPGGPYGSET